MEVEEQTHSLIEWTHHEFEFQESPTDFYWGVLVAGIAFGILGVYLENYLFVLIIILAVFMILIYANRKPQNILVKVFDEGLEIEGLGQSWIYYQSFWIGEHHRGETTLYLEKRVHYFDPIVVLHVPDGIDLAYLRDILLNHLEEHYIQETWIHRKLDEFGF